MIRCLKKSQNSNLSPVYNVLNKPHAKKSNGVKSGDLGGQAVGPSPLMNTWQELEYRLDICQATTGAHIEVYGRV
jgi:hypothetical protein